MCAIINSSRASLKVIQVEDSLKSQLDELFGERKLVGYHQNLPSAKKLRMAGVRLQQIIICHLNKRDH